MFYFIQASPYGLVPCAHPPQLNISAIHQSTWASATFLTARVHAQQRSTSHKSTASSIYDGEIQGTCDGAHRDTGPSWPLSAIKCFPIFFLIADETAKVQDFIHYQGTCQGSIHPINHADFSQWLQPDSCVYFLHLITFVFIILFLLLIQVVSYVLCVCVCLCVCMCSVSYSV